jgi:4,5-DOPA dioxygenase extradiol
LGLQNENEEAALFNDKAVGGSLTMTSVQVG